MNSTRKTTVVNVIGFLMILSALFFMMMPVLSMSIIDYGSTTTAKFTEKKDGSGELSMSSRELSVNYNGFENFNENVLIKFQKLLKLPTEFTVIQSIMASAGMIFLFIFFMGFFIDIEKDDKALFRLIIPATVLVAIALVVAPFWGNDFYNIFEGFGNSINGNELVSAVIMDYLRGVMVSRTLIGIAGMIICGFMFLMLAIEAWSRIWINFIVGNLYMSWKKRIFEEFFGTGNEIIQIFPNGVIELVKFDYNLKWKPLPVLVLSEEVIIPFSNNLTTLF